MLYFGNETPLKGKLMEYDKESLKGFAQDIMVKGAYKMKKEELADRIAEYLLTPEVLFYRMAVLTDRDLAIFEKGCGCVTTVSNDAADIDALGRLNAMDLVVAHHGEYFVPNDLAEVWRKIKTSKFEAYRKRASWVWQCLNFAEEFYGYIPVECLLAVVNTKKGMNMKEDELYDIFEKFPVDQLWTVRVSEDIFLDSRYIDDMDALEALRRAQAGKDHYVPSAAEVVEFYETNGFISDKPYQDMKKFFEKEMGLSELEANDLLLELFDRIAFDDDPHGTMQWLWNLFEFTGEDQVKKIVSLYMPLANGTRMLANCGFKPTELGNVRHNWGPGAMPVITAGSSKAAEMLKDLIPEMEKRGIKIDLNEGTGTVPVIQYPNGINGPATVVEKKVYPNDLCPCGSGKKYKKCCGRK